LKVFIVFESGHSSATARDVAAAAAAAIIQLSKYIP
jgi:hypothetical protein